MKNIRFVFAVMCFSIPISLFAERGVQHQKVAPETYGTSSLTYVSLVAWEFRPQDSTVTYTFVPGAPSISRSNTTGSGVFQAPIKLPAGAIVSYLEMYSCNYVGFGGTITSSFRGLKTDGSYGFSQSTGPSSPSTSCAVTSTTIAPVLIDNTTTAYTVEVNFTSGNGQSGLGAYRVGYKLQVSPAPAFATFADVPVGHPFHRFVEALVASGITFGCGGGNYCPDASITRGQMAVFLSGALGLHWAP